MDSVMIVRMKRLVIPFVFLGFQLSFAQTFENISPQVSFANYEGKMVLVDINNDGYPEIIQSGSDRFSVYQNNNGVLGAEITREAFRFNNHILSVDVGDINRDGFIDVLQSGNNFDQRYTPQLLLNQGANLFDFSGATNFSFPGSREKYLGDYEGDGDLDIIASDNNGILLNEKTYWRYGPYFPKHAAWYSNWCDLDADSKLEAVQVHGISNFLVGSYMLDDGSPSLSISATFPYPTLFNDVRFADYDSDGDFDMVTKLQDSENHVSIFTNQNGTFVASGIKFSWGGSIDVGDINNDGLYDVVVSGTMGAWMVFETAVYLNNGNGSFTKLNVQLPSIERGTACLGDFDGDGDLDIASQGGLFKNKTTVTNAAPVAPSFTGSNVSGTTTELFWAPGSDDKTPLLGLTYNVEVRDESGALVVSAHALASGKRQLAKLGNAYNKLTYQLKCLKQGTYSWRVQTLDASYQGSPFSAAQTFVITTPPPFAPNELTAKAVSEKGIQLTWQDVSTSEDQFIIFRKDPGSEFYPIDTVALNGTSYLDTLYLQPLTTYSYRVAASNCAYPDENYAAASAKTLPLPFINSEWLNLGNVKGTFALLGDYDNDRDLDLILTYSGATKLFRFDETGYVDSGITFTGTVSAGTWLDINNDGFLDVLLVAAGVPQFYENVMGVSFNPISQQLPLTIDWHAGISIGDYDQNGSDDILVQTGAFMSILTNQGSGNFVASGINLPGFVKSSGAWADFDKDGDLDILASKKVSCTAFNLVVYENKLGVFVPIEFANLPSTNDLLHFTGEMEWGDYDNDGYPDILVAGQNTCSNSGGITHLYRNQRNRTFAMAFQLPALTDEVQVDWGDYDNDGDLDVFAYGNRGVPRNARIYRNDGSQFKDAKIVGFLDGIQFGKAVRGDIDHDGDLDYVILGEVNYTTPRIIVYRNMYADTDWNKPNQSPLAPGELQSVIDDETITLSWASAADPETPDSGLTYNLYVIDETDSLIMNSYSLPDGHRSIVSPGNASSQLSWKLTNLPPGTYRWAVQAIDKGFTGSAFSEENTFTVSPVTGIDDSPVDISVYPNPTRDFITVVSPRYHGPLVVEIRNFLGAVVSTFRQTASEAVYNLSSFPAGMYYVTIKNQHNAFWSEKVVVH